MRLLFATIRAHIPQRNGGGQQSIHALLLLLSKRGHTCEAVVSFERGARLHLFRLLRRLSGRRWRGWRDERNGYATFRTHESLVAQLASARIAKARPDVIVTDFKDTNEVAAEAVRRKIPTLVRVISLGCVDRHIPMPRHPLVLAYANSAFVAGRLRAEYGIQVPVVYPLVMFDQYRARRRDPAFITLINPIERKGLSTALEIAHLLPHRLFLFVEGAPLDASCRASLASRMARVGNVAFMRSQRDVRDVYARTSILIVPSEWDEPFGRVVLEAQANGIPVIARDVGGLRESVGRGGILIKRTASPADWADAMENLLADDAGRECLSAAALANTRRAEFQPEHIVDSFLAVVQQLLQQAARTSEQARRSSSLMR
jgi:glycosyltransferase involved in cell wall biosynthesis